MALLDAVKAIVVLFALAFPVDGAPASIDVVVPIDQRADFTHLTFYCVPTKILEKTGRTKNTIEYEEYCQDARRRRQTPSRGGKLMKSMKKGMVFGVSGKELSDMMSKSGFNVHETFETNVCKKGETYVVAFQNQIPKLSRQ